MTSRRVVRIASTLAGAGFAGFTAALWLAAPHDGAGPAALAGFFCAAVLLGFAAVL